MVAGRPRNKEPTRLLSVRVPASIYDPVRGFADNHAEKMSGIVVEALKIYTKRVIENRCRICSAPNQEDLEWCGVCGAPLTPKAEIEYQRLVDDRHRLENQNYGWNAALMDRFDARIKDIGTKLVSDVMTQLQSCDENQDLPPSTKRRPDDEQTPDIDPK